ncbi:MAG: hypothetical protein ACYCTZ_15040 [Candidatus Dormibacteria bacterium]
MVTETKAITAALSAAPWRWPGDAASRGRLPGRLVEEGHAASAQQQVRAGKARRGAVIRAAGLLTGDYGTDYLSELREDWST